MGGSVCDRQLARFRQWQAELREWLDLQSEEARALDAADRSASRGRWTRKVEEMMEGGAGPAHRFSKPPQPEILPAVQQLEDLVSVRR